MNYIFIIGAPGSRWSAVSQSIYQSADIDRSDASKEHTYKSLSSKNIIAKHQGSYFDPGMEFGQWFSKIQNYNKQYIKLEFDRPFKDINTINKFRIIKSHTLAFNIDYLRHEWKFSKVILIYRPNNKCFSWWKTAGGFNITYPSYAWYKHDNKMKREIYKQNSAILKYMNDNNLDWNITTNTELCDSLNISYTNKLIDYNEIDTKVCVI